MAMRDLRRAISFGWMIGSIVTLAACATPAPSAAPTAAAPALPTASESGSYPVRYFHTEQPVSLEPPPGWQVTEETDGGALAEVAEPQNGARILLTSVPSNAGAPDANLQAVHASQGAQAQIGEEREFTFNTGEVGFLRRGTTAESGTWAVATLASQDVAVHLLFSAPSTASETPFDAFLVAARSLRFEPTEPLAIDRATTLSLDAGEAEELDPALTHAGPSGAVGDLFRGLVVLDPSLQVRPALAEGWDVSPDGAVYTFHLNPAARFHNGRPVTADDVVFSWERAASADLGSSTVLTYMGDIAGLSAYNAGQAATIRGLQVVDDRTLQVSLEIPRPTFLYKLAYPVSWIVDRANVGFPGWERYPNGTGPFRVVQHLKDQVLLLEANPWFYAGRPAIEHIRYLMYAGYTQQLYEQGEVDQAWVTRDQVTRVEDSSDGLYGTLLTEPALCTNYVSFNTSLPPFDDPKVRQAFARSIDLERYVEAITNGEDIVARGLLPPGMPGYGAALEPQAYDPEAARALLAESGYGLDGMPKIIWTVPTSGGWASPGVAFLADSWQRALGVEVQLEGVEWQEYYQRLDAGDYGQILLEGWCADYPDPENFLEALFHSSSAQNHARYASAEFDRLVEAARIETDVAKRLELYRQAEQLLLNDAPAAFLDHSGPSFMVWKPYTAGYLPSAIGVPQHAAMWIGK
jgi:oligopeptide transport system substrate-binding protein